MDKIRTKFLLVIAFFSTVLTVFLIARNCRSNIDRLQEQISLQTELALEFDLAIREYVGQTIRPFAVEHLGSEEFVPETMSTSYVARSVFEKVRSRFPDYVIKFSSDDARNPANLANAAELAVIERFNHDPELQRWSGEITIDQQEYYALFSARRMKESCLRCHGNPQDAPASLTEQYGSTAGFHRSMGEIIALDTVAIPIEDYKATILQRSIADSCFIVVGLSLFFVGVFWVFNRLVSKRLSAISRYFRQVAEQKDLSTIHLIETDSQDEIGVMAQSFNFFAGRLRCIYDSLERLVEEKTAVLQDVNQDLQAEVEFRKEAEQSLKAAQQKLLLHVQQTPLGVIEWDTDLRVTSWNPAAENIFGYSSDEAIGRMGTDLILPKSLSPQISKVLSEMRQGTGGEESTNENICKNGKIIVCQWYNTPLVDESGNVIAIASLVQDITRQVEYEKKLQQAKQDAEDASKAKSEFLANMSHEIRTPMNSIIGFSDILIDEALDEDQRNYVETIQSSGKSLLCIINDILDYSKIEAGNLAIELVGCSLDRILEDVCTLMDYSAKEKNLGLTVDNRSEIQSDIAIDPVRLKQCLVNLVGNAIKFTETGSIAVRVTRETVDEQSRLRFDVEDTGIGIAADKIKTIFKSFQQADGSTTRKYGGTGLGLTITRNLIQLMGGDITVESEPEKGSTFSFTVPLQIAQSEVNDAQQATPEANS